jgi:hypothetical protein
MSAVKERSISGSMDLGPDALVRDIHEYSSHLTEGRLPGNDNREIGCTTRDVIVGNIIDHLGPYNGIWIGC